MDNNNSHILNCDFVYDDLPCNCDGRPTCFWVTPIWHGASELKPDWLKAQEQKQA